MYVQLFIFVVSRLCILKKERLGFSQVCLGRPAGSAGFRRVNSPPGFYLDPDRSQARVGRVPGRPAGPVRVSKLCLYLSDRYTYLRRWTITATPHTCDNIYKIVSYANIFLRLIVQSI